MSIRIDREKCAGCGRCVEACPGNLIKKDADGIACIRHERDCWGCASCLKECRFGAIQYFLGADIGGRGAVLSVKKMVAPPSAPLRPACVEHSRDDKNSAHCAAADEILLWQVTDPGGESREIRVNSKEANRY
ncbi:MAG: ferredoxin family protein [Lachnospiraceae bacterium]|nr:ferredoxin family protein [Lachnospiraceae bacterium]